MAGMQARNSRAQNLLLFSKLIDCRDNTSPFTLILDSLEQTAGRVLDLYIQRANAVKSSVVYVSYQTFRRPPGVQKFIRAYDHTADKVQAEIRDAVGASNSSAQRSLIIIDTLHTLASTPGFNIAAYLSGLIAANTTLVCVYHTDQPLSTHTSQSAYAPSTLTLLQFLATSVFTLHSFSHVLAERAARERSVAAPNFGLHEDAEGVVQGLGSQDPRGVVVEMEHRRRSGRSIHALLFCEPVSSAGKAPAVVLLDDHPLYKRDSAEDQAADEGLGEVSFNLSLTDKQRRDREGVVLPYFDAQNADAAPGEGGRILYDMGAEDDFDEEEDEI